MGLLNKYLRECIEEMEKDQINLEFYGDLTRLSPELQELCASTREISNHYQGKIQVNICLNYGGRDEIIHAMKAWQADCAAGRANPDDLDENVFSQYLYSKDTPDPDLIIRPSGEVRISNFLMWQSAYSEFYFTDVLWPDFSKDDLLEAIAAYQKRSRRYGGV
jgi:undecaprenyl diphosphate synthase